MFSDSFSSFYTVNIQKLKESERIYKGQKRFTKGFLEINVACFARKNETFLACFKHCMSSKNVEIEDKTSIMLEQKKVRSKRTQFPLFPFIVSDGKRGKKAHIQLAHGFSPGDGFLASSMSPDIFLRKRLCMFFSSMFLSLSPKGALHLA